MALLLRDLYAVHKPQGIDRFPSTVTDHFRHLFQSQEALNQIPVLDLQHPPESFPNGSLVVFNAMVQDTSLSPELYLANLPNGECGGWGMADRGGTQTDQIQYMDLRECSIFWAVSIPRMSEWCKTKGPSAGNVAPHRCAQPHKFPLPDVPHIGVQLKVYDDSLAKPLRTTDLVSFVGILTSELLHSSIDMPTPLDVPTLHVLFSEPIPNTIIPRLFRDPSLLPTVKSLRGELIQWIADEALAGDHVAAEWILLCSIARVRSRHPPVLPLSLTITGFSSPSENPNSTPALHHVLSQIFPIVTTLPLSLNTLNNTSFCPESKDEDLHSGWLQYPKGSILILTEGAITEGGIFNKGIMNVRSLQEMMKVQTLEYIFPFSGFQFETDVDFLVVTEGKQSTFFKTDVSVPLQPRGSMSDAKKNLYKPADAISLPSEAKLVQFRRLVGGSKIGNVIIAETTGKHVQEDFVQERSTQADKKIRGLGFTPDDLIQRMLVARLIALSLHEAEVTVENWEYAKELESLTKSR